MRLVIVLATLSIALPFVISNAALSFGNAVSMRFLERPTHKGVPAYIIAPETETGKPLDEASLTEWVATRKEFANGYATRVIPLDMLYLFVLGGFLGVASATLAGLVSWPRAIADMPDWVRWALPVLYIVCDFAEDTLIFVLLTWPSTISASALAAIAVSRSIKIGSVSIAIIQVLVLSLLSYIWLRPAGS
jgi:hypothetical protein